MSTTIQPRRLAERLCRTIGECRQALDMPASEFAARIGQPLSFLLKLERAELSPTYQVIRDCARVLDVTVKELIEISILGCVAVFVDEAECNLRDSA